MNTYPSTSKLLVAYLKYLSHYRNLHSCNIRGNSSIEEGPTKKEVRLQQRANMWGEISDKAQAAREEEPAASTHRKGRVTLNDEASSNQKQSESLQDIRRAQSQANSEMVK
jgi:hypothetical protein